MAAQYHPIYPTYWAEAKRQKWSRDATTLGAFILTCRHRRSEGLFQLPLTYIAHDLAWKPAHVDAALAELVERKFVRYDAANEVVFICNALRFHTPRGAKSVSGAVNALLAAPSTDLRSALLQAADRHAPELAGALRVRGWSADTACPIDAPSMGVEWGLPPTPTPTPTPNNDNVEPSRLDDARQARNRERTAQIRSIFDTWIEVTNRTGATQFSPERRRLIARALDSYPFEDVLAAVKGWRNLAHNRGENATGEPFNDIELLLRNAKQIERFRDAEIGARSTRAVLAKRFLTAAELQAAEDAQREAS